MAFNDVIEKTGMAIDAAGVVVIVTGAAIAFVAAAVRLSRRESDVYRRFRQQLGQTILLGLELLVAGDIVRTVAASPSLTSVAILAAIVLIRTFLSFSLQVEITGRWPWQKREITAPLNQERPACTGRPVPVAPKDRCPRGRAQSVGPRVADRKWDNYFRHAVAKNVFAMLDNFASWLVIRMLRQRHRWRWKDVRQQFTDHTGHA